MISQIVPVYIIQLENCCIAVNISLDIRWHIHKWNSQFLFSKCWSIGTFNGGTGMKHFWDVCITGSVYPPLDFSKFTWTLNSQHGEVNKEKFWHEKSKSTTTLSPFLFMSHILWILRVYSHVHEIPPPLHIQSQSNSDSARQAFFLIHFSIVFPSIHRSCRQSLSFRFLHQYHVCLFLPSHVPHAQPISSSLIWSRE